MRYEQPAVDDRALWDIWLSLNRLPTLVLADELGIFKALAEQPSTPAALAERRSFDRRGTEAVLVMLASLGLAQAREGVYELTDLARTYLLPESPFYWGPLIRVFGMIPQLHSSLVDAMTKKRANQQPDGTRPADGWEQGTMSPEVAAAVSRVMHIHSLPAAVTLAGAPELAGVRRLLDVGGGSGCFSIAFAQRLPNLRCTVMELAAVGDVAKKYIAEGKVADRVDTKAVDMFRERWPEGYDAIFFSNVFHDWGVETNTRLARSAFDALPSGGKIFLHEMLIDANGTGPTTTASFSMLMVATNQGKQYSLEELRNILEMAGFTDVKATPAHGYYSLVSAVKA